MVSLIWFSLGEALSVISVLRNWTCCDDGMHRDQETDMDPTNWYRPTLLKLMPNYSEENQASFDSCHFQLSYAS